MTLGDRLRQARGARNQRAAAEAVSVARELISMWETGARVPSDEYLKRLAKAYHVSYESLAGTEGIDEWAPQAVLFRKADGAMTRDEETALSDWLGFLDRWAEWLSDFGPIGEQARGIRRPPKPLEGIGPVYDTRRAPTLAVQVREYLRVGDGPLPDLYALLDTFGVLVYRNEYLPELSASGVVSGAFLNHPVLGYSVFVNARCSAGRQAFTLAHELAHALFHYPERALVSRSGDQAQEERFANSFASHFLVPGKELRRLAKMWLGGIVDAYAAVQLASLFRVSYAMMLYRLLDEGLAERSDVDIWKTYSPVAMAERLGVSTEPFCHVPAVASDDLERFPLSVRNAAQHALMNGRIHLSQAADVLGVPEHKLLEGLAPPIQTDKRAASEFDEYPWL